MKKVIFSFLLCVFSFVVFASEVSDLLQEAQTAYESGDVSTAIQKLESAKSIMEKEQLSSVSNDYIEIKSWDVVKLKKSDYIGKKVKVKSKYLGPNSNGSVYLLNVDPNCTYDESLIDKLLSLKTYDEYTFYGTVKIKNSTPSLHIEGIE